MKNIFKLLIDAIKDERNNFHLDRATGLFQHKGSLESPDKDETDFYRRKHQIIFGQSRNLTRCPPIVVVILKDNDDEQ